MITNLTQSAITSNYLAVVCSEAWNADHLSPHVMQWSPTVKIVDLSTTLKFWQQRATECRCTIEELLSELLPSTAIAVLADHPWRAVLGSKVWQGRTMRPCSQKSSYEIASASSPKASVLNALSPIGQSLVRGLTWSDWQEGVLEVLKHYESLKAAAKSVASLQRFLRQFLLTMGRMGLKTPLQLKDVGYPDMRRRFGDVLARLWEWTWANADLTSPTQNELNMHCRDLFSFSELDGFPWIYLPSIERPEVHTILMHPLKQWDYIESYLLLDLDRLCQLACWDSRERVVSLEWVLSFSHRPALTIPVLFRYPHNLHREAGHHKTTLLQGFHSWNNAMSHELKEKRQLMRDENVNTIYFDEFSVTGWSLRVKEKIAAPQFSQSLFDSDLDSPAARLREIENSLPINLESYQICMDWTWQDSHRVGCLGKDDDESAELCHSLHHQFLQRPFFMCVQPEKQLMVKGPHTKKIFTERTMLKWWQKQPEKKSNRNYFRVIDERGSLLWAYCDDVDADHMWVQGVYG